jgi:hypothetical protein
MNYFYCSDGDSIEGPVPAAALHGFLSRGLVPQSTLVCAEGTTEWAFITTLLENSKKPPRTGRRRRNYPAPDPEYEVVLRDVAFTRRQRGNKSLHTLQGMLLGFSLDGVISLEELAELKAWSADHHQLFAKHPFNEIAPKINFAVESGGLSTEDRDDLVWLCQQLSEKTPFYDAITSDMQRLQGLLHGALADGQLLDVEIEGLRDWLSQSEGLERVFPYDELVSLVNSALADGRVEEAERATLVHFFEKFVTYSAAKRADRVFNSGLPPRRLSGICAYKPSIEFDGRRFSFTGASAVAPRKMIATIVEELGGMFSGTVSSETDYLVVGDAGNPAWAYACYGRKVEQAMKLRSEGAELLVVHERDFWPKVEAVRGAPIVP